jgi:hypothetical protein
MQIVIIGRNEGDSIEKMIESTKGYERIWVADRCNDNTIKKLNKYKENYIKTPIYLFGRQTSYVRNLGLSKTDGVSNVLFLDGDRFVEKGSLSDLESTKSDVSLLKVVDDTRDDTPYSEFYGKIHNNFYSCGVFFKRDAINKILHFQKGELFDISVQSMWGIEDTYLGDVCYHLGLTIDYYNGCLLYGGFENKNVGSDNMILRFSKRQNLNVKWC